jgi:hypothetical protein
MFPRNEFLATASPPEFTTLPVLVLVLSVVLDAVIVVKKELDGIVDPIVPGFAKVFPLRNDTLRFGTLVVLEMEKGAVPVETVLVKYGLDTKVPTYNFLPIAAPPEIVIAPPFAILVASIELFKPIPPDNKNAPEVDELELVVFVILIVSEFIIFVFKNQ